MRKILFLLFLSSCANPLINHHQCDWRSILWDPLMNDLMDQTPISSSAVAGVYVQYRGLQQRSDLLSNHIANYDEMILLTSDLVDRGISSALDLQALISFQASLKGQLYKLNTQLEKLLSQLATLVKTYPEYLGAFLCQPGCLPIPMRDIPCGPCLDLINFYNDEDRVSALIVAEEAARLSYGLTEDLFRRGLKSTIDLIMAHKIWIAAEDELIQARVDYLVDYITLYGKY